MGIPPILWFNIWAEKFCTSDWTAEKPQHGSQKINLKVCLFNLVNNDLLSSVAFAFVTVLLAYFGKLAVSYALVFLPVLGLLWGNFPCPLSQHFSNTIYACAFTCACSFTVCSVHLAQYCSVLVFFSLPPHLLLLLVMVLLTLYLHWTRFSVMDAWAGAGCGGRGSWLSCG